jgi:hypothetical protein
VSPQFAATRHDCRLLGPGVVIVALLAATAAAVGVWFALTPRHLDRVEGRVSLGDVASATPTGEGLASVRAALAAPGVSEQVSSLLDLRGAHAAGPLSVEVIGTDYLLRIDVSDPTVGAEIVEFAALYLLSLVGDELVEVARATGDPVAIERATSEASTLLGLAGPDVETSTAPPSDGNRRLLTVVAAIAAGSGVLVTGLAVGQRRRIIDHDLLATRELLPVVSVRRASPLVTTGDGRSGVVHRPGAAARRSETSPLPRFRVERGTAVPRG